MNENLSQDEIDTLLNGVDSGEVDTSSDMSVDGEVVAYDLESQDRIIRGSMPTLDMINERYLRYLNKSAFKMMRKNVEVTSVGVKMVKFSDYVRDLFLPTSMNMITINPLRGTGLFVLDANLVFSSVDNYFGGDGRYHTRIETNEFTPTENRVIQLMLDMLCNDLQKAWEPIIDLDFQVVNSEINPQFVNIVNPTEVIVVMRFKMEFDGSGGEFHFAMPYSMLEPIRELLDAGMNNDQSNVDPRWSSSLKDEIQQAVVELDSTMCETRLTLGDVLNLNEGDVIPVKMPDVVTVRAAKTPIFRGILGNSNGKNAVQFVSPIVRKEYPQE